MKQRARTGFEKSGKTTPGGLFPADIISVVHLRELGNAVESIYPEGCPGGRQLARNRAGAEIAGLLSAAVVQRANHAVELALCTSAWLRRLADIDLERAMFFGGETTIGRFRHFPELSGTGEELLKAMNTYLRETRIKLDKGAIVDAVNISRPVRPRIGKASATLRSIRPPTASIGISA